MFEAEFANKFLYGKFSYNYEKPYNDGTKRKCDFYVEALDLWIECAYNELIDKFEYQTKKSHIPLHNASYNNKESVKCMGAKWNPTEKYWYIPMELNTGQRLKKFEPYMSEQNLTIVQSDNKQITESYSEDIRQKLYDNTDKRIIIVSKKDLETCNSFNDVLRVCDNKYFKQLISQGKIWDGFPDYQSYKKPDETDLDLAIRIFNNLQPDDKNRFIQRKSIQKNRRPKRKKNRNKKAPAPISRLDKEKKRSDFQVCFNR